MSLPESESVRLIDAEWQAGEEQKKERYIAELKIFANDRKGLLVDVSKAFTEKNIGIISLNTRTNKQGQATMQVSFEVSGREELARMIDKLSGIESVLDIVRTTG